MEPDQFKAIYQLLRAALLAASERLRDLPRPDPEIYPATIEEDVLAACGLPNGKEEVRDLRNLVEVLRIFADSVRIAERKDRPILPLMPREHIPPRRP
jgi:hypothetical protein